MSSAYYIGQRLSFESQLCTVRYVGEVKGTTGEWLGVEWDDSARGRHSGNHNGTVYFECRAPGAGSFVRPNRPHDQPNTFLEGLKEKYITNVAASGVPKPIVFGSKVAEEVGFEKVSKKFSELDTLTRVSLDYMRIKTCDADSNEIAVTCANMQEVDLSCNLFEDLEEIGRICASLPRLHALFINGNQFTRFQAAEEYIRSFNRIKALRAEDLRLSWRQLFELVDNFPNVTDLSIAVGDLVQLSPAMRPRLLDLQAAPSLVSLCLEENEFSSLADLSDLQKLPSLRRLLLSRNKIQAVYSAPGSKADDRLSFPTITFLDISRNKVDGWMFLDDMRDVFPNLEALRISQNPLYDTGGNRDKALSERVFQITVGRLGPKVTSLNYSVITPAERADAELFYISTIVKELSEKPADQEPVVLAQHTRWTELQALHGEQVINRELAKKSNDALASKLIVTELNYGSKTLTKKFPRTITIGKLAGLVGRLFGANPLDIVLYLVETGITGEEGIRETLLSDELRELDYYVVDANAKLLVREK
ncbi:hypothetical protein DRE_02220 [Drechslerella stenobrocha 248]|uniref:CAP-Gly domain-containing protein n=1 Tax=Drechslerella stenobrocha 248 TaxID=1043628 RepID=W7HWA1_9PEZI|nr:hypothetical protein DRE_02220 [Drechslerella stenobrocha 248]